ncbi:hypothetical protein V8D89_001171 [Ganoderma adspersum]
MSRSPSTRAPTPFYPVDPAFGDNRTIHLSPRTSRSSMASNTASAWTDAVSSQSSSPSPSEWVVLLPPHAVNHVHPLPLPSSNAGYGIPPPAFQGFPGTGTVHYPPHSSPMVYAPPPPSNPEPASSWRTSSSAHPRSSTRHRSERDGHSTRALDTIPCQICLQPETVCTCVGGDDARLRMRKAARRALNRRTEGATDPSATQHGHWQEQQVVPQALGPGYAQGSGYAAGYGAPMVYAGSPVPVYSGQPAAMGGYTSGYYSTPGVVPTSQIWADEQQGVSGPVWGVRAG